MNKSPESFETDLERERLLESSKRVPADPALAADWHLRNELRQFGPTRLPDEVRLRVLRRRRRAGYRPWLGAIAAALLVAVAVPVLRNAPEPVPAGGASGEELVRLGLALDTIRDAGVRAARLTRRELSQGLVLPDMEFPDVPLAGLVARTLRPRPASTGTSMESAPTESTPTDANKQGETS